VSTRAVHVTEWGDEGERVVLVHGSLAAGPETWAEQHALAERYRLVVPDRRSYGDSPDGDGDFERDADDVADLLADGAHLVGNSYGGVVALLAAARRPDAVRSLVVGEPPAFKLAREDAAVAEFLRRVHTARAEARDGADYAARFVASFGFDPPERPLEGRALRAATASWRERPPDEADVALDVLAAAPFSTLVVRGAWDVAPPEAQRIGRPAFHAVCDVLADRLQAEQVTIAGTAHAAHRGAAYNDELERFWAGARQPA
jgi:pimeloyl-ACP methyl ester carboxylesterase